MASWLVAQIAHQRHELVSTHVTRIGLQSFYPQWRRTKGRLTETKALYPGYMFVRSPSAWYCVVECCSAVFGVVARQSTLEPLRSDRLDSHIEKLMEQSKRDGFVSAPAQRSKFLRGDKIYVGRGMFMGEATYVRSRGSDGAEITVGLGTALVRESDLQVA